MNLGNAHVISIPYILEMISLQVLFDVRNVVSSNASINTR